MLYNLLLELLGPQFITPSAIRLSKIDETKAARRGRFDKLPEEDHLVNIFFSIFLLFAFGSSAVKVGRFVYQGSSICVN